MAPRFPRFPPDPDGLDEAFRHLHGSEAVEAYDAAVHSAIAEGGTVLDVDPAEFGLPEDFDDGERRLAHVMARDD
jgi:hypothetical protein